MTFESFREIMYICQRFLADKINSIDVEDIVKIFRRKMNIQANIQYLLFNQTIHPLLRLKYKETKIEMKKKRAAIGQKQLQDSSTV